jgi:dolichol-phosphate mannosyltransferase
MLISLVVSVFNEENVIGIFYDALKKYTINQNFHFEFIFVNDGSTDASLDVLNNIFNQDERIKIINFSRNFGHESAMLAGIEHSKGDLIICMDSDLQHPPAKIPEIIQKFSEGFEVISMVRKQRDDEGFLGRLTSKYFYRLLNKLSDFKFEPNASDFFAISRRVANVVSTNFKDRNRFLRGFIQQVGFRKSTIDYEAPKRAGGTSKYSFYKLLVFSIAVIVANSRTPLRFSIFISFLFGLFSIIVAIYSIVMKLVGNPFSGYTTLIVFMSISFSLLFFVIGVLGEYIGNLYQEIKARPIYIIESIFEHKK